MISLKVFSFFKSKGPKQFEYKPRYYNPQKEAMESRRKQIEQEIGRGASTHDPEVFRSRLRERWGRSSRARANSRSAITRMIIIAVMIFLLYYILK